MTDSWFSAHHTTKPISRVFATVKVEPTGDHKYTLPHTYLDFGRSGLLVGVEMLGPKPQYYYVHRRAEER